MVAGQTILFQQADTLFHVHLGKVIFSLLMIHCAYVGMEIRCQVGILGIDFSQSPNGVLNQKDRLGSILLAGCPAFQQQSTVCCRANGLVCKDAFYLTYNCLHPGFIMILLHVLKDIFQEQQIFWQIVLPDQCNNVLHRLEQLLIP